MATSTSGFRVGDRVSCIAYKFRDDIHDSQRIDYGIVTEVKRYEVTVQYDDGLLYTHIYAWPSFNTLKLVDKHQEVTDRKQTEEEDPPCIGYDLVSIIAEDL